MPADTSGRKLVTLVVPVFNESEVISVFYARARATSSFSSTTGAATIHSRS